MENINILTFDVEDYFQVENFKKVIKFSDWDNYESRVVLNTEKILSILGKQKAKATFFILGWIAERFPELVKKIDDLGHEIASHGNNHQLIYKQTKDEFREDIRKSKKILEDIIKKPILGYRAPCYSITKESLWALEILAEEGFKYDSSLFPISHDRGGLSSAKRFAYEMNFNGRTMVEYPISTLKVLNKNIPFSGGGYFRLLPYGLIKNAFKKINSQNQPVVTYFHPWEFDPKQPKIKAGFLNGFRHYLNLNKMEHKLTQLLKDFKFKPACDFYLENSCVKGEF